MARQELFNLGVLQVDDDDETSGKVPNIKEALSRRQLSAGRTADYRLPEVPASLGTGYQLNILTAMRVRTLDKKAADNSESLVLWHKSPILRRIYAKSAPPPGEPLKHSHAFKKAATEKAEEGRQSSMTVDHEIRRVFRGFDFRDVDVSNLPVVKDILKDGDSEMPDANANPDKTVLVKKRPRKDSRCEPQKRHHGTNGLDDTPVSSGVQDCEATRSYKTDRVSKWIAKHFRHRSHWDDI